MKYYTPMSSALESMQNSYECTSIGGGNPINNSTPNVEVLANATIGISLSAVAKMGTSINVVSVNECEAHVLGKNVISIPIRQFSRDNTYTWRIISSTCRTEDEVITPRNVRLDQRLGRITTTLLDVRKRPWRRIRLLPSEVGLLRGRVDISICSTL